MAGDSPRTSKGRPPDDEWSLRREDVQKSMVRRVQELMTPDIMEVILYGSVMVRCVRARCFTTELAVIIVDRIRRKFEVTSFRAVGGCRVCYFGHSS
jgi:hypothetical protein